MRGLVPIATLFLSHAIACSDSPPSGDANSEVASSVPQIVIAADPERGRTLVERFECARCHQVPDVPAIGADKHCVGCHEQIEEGRFRSDHGVVTAGLLAEWRHNIVSLRFVPPLDRGWLRRGWIAGYLLAPHDLRPHLVADMPRLDIDATEAADIAAFVGDDADEVPIEGNPEAGRALYRDKGCASCHRFDGAGVAEAKLSLRGTTRAQALAPDLRHTRARVAPHRLVTWLLSPNTIRPGGAMPSVPLSQGEARDLVAFITRAPLAPQTPKPEPPRLPLLDREITFDEVNQRVFRKVCWHCHAQPDYAMGDGGPGKSGGFGFPPRELDLSSYEAIAAGYINPDGHMASIFARTNGMTVVVATLLARQGEERGEPDSMLRGMPLGLPSLPPEDIQLVESWIAQGRRR